MTLLMTRQMIGAAKRRPIRRARNQLPGSRAPGRLAPGRYLASYNAPYESPHSQ